jgi:dihydrofolate reductase
MTKCSVFIAMSLDGFISRPNGEIDWLEKANEAVPKDEDFGYSQFMSTVDALVMGRNTFEKVCSFNNWPYGETPVVVMSRNLHSLPVDIPKSVTLSADHPVQIVGQLSARGFQHLYIDGGKTIQSFVSSGLIDELTITIIPVLLGAGIPLFGKLPQDVWLECINSRDCGFGFVQSKYRVIKG